MESLSISKSLFALGALFLGLVAAPSAHAQVSGTVVDASGQPVADARVTLQATSLSTTTDAQGRFDLAVSPGANLLLVAAKQGFFNKPLSVLSPSTAVQFALDPVPTMDNPNFTFRDPSSCGGCHPDQYAEWNGSRMANAGVNTWLYDIFNGTGTPGGMGGFVYTRDSTHAITEPASDCAPCHQPEPWVRTRDMHNGIDDINNLSAGARHGISCDICHKIANVDLTKTNYPGLHPLQTLFLKPDVGHQVQFGALADTSYSILGVMQPAYNPQLTSATCAACHQDKNDPDEDGDFEEANGVVSEPTWQEWISSPYGDPASPKYASCAECHMPPTTATQAASMGPQRPAGSIRSHKIEGTTARYLENSVDLDVTTLVTGNEVEAEVKITNSGVGHHVPTGVTVRNMILLVEAYRASDNTPLTSTGTQTVHALGGVGDPSLGYYASLPGKLYAKLNHDAQGNGPTFYTDATGIQWDNRIPALATDATSYSFQIPPGTAAGDVRVRARVIYRRAFRAFVDAKGWTEDGMGQPLKDLEAPHYGHLMEDLTVQVTGGSSSADTTLPTFVGVTAATSASPTTVELSWWPPAADNVSTPQEISYRIFLATTSGGQDFSQPTATSAPGAAGATLGSLSANTTYYAVVRAVDAAGNVDTNTFELTVQTPAGGGILAPNVEVTLRRYSSNAGAFSAGQRVGMLIMFRNTSSSDQVLDGEIDVETPGGQRNRLVGPVQGLRIPAGRTRYYLLNLRLGAQAAAGTYTVAGQFADQNGGFDLSTFQFDVN